MGNSPSQNDKTQPPRTEGQKQDSFSSDQNQIMKRGYFGIVPITVVKAFKYAESQNIPSYFLKCDLTTFVQTMHKTKGMAIQKSTNTIYAWYDNHLIKISNDGEISEITITWTSTLPEVLQNVPWINLGCVFDDSRNKVITAHTSSHFISECDPTDKTIRIIAGQPQKAGSDNGESAKAKFSYPKGMRLDSKRNLWICDMHSIRKMNIEDDMVSKFAGENVGFHNGSCSEARFNSIWDLDFDEKEKFMYVLDTGNCAIRKIDMTTNIVSTFISNLPPVCRSLKVTPRSIFVTAEGLIQRVDLQTQEITIIASAGQLKDSGVPLKMPCNMLQLSYGPLIIADDGVLLKLIFGVPWEIQRVIWIGNLKNGPSHCHFAKLPKDVIREILKFCAVHG